MTSCGLGSPKFSLRSTIIVLCALLALVGCDDSNEKPTRVWTEVYKEYPDGTVTRWELRGAAVAKNGCISWIKSPQEEVCLCGSISTVIHRDPVEVSAKAVNNEKSEALEGEGGKEENNNK